MDLNKAFGTDKNLEENGVWITIDDTSAVHIARFKNKKFLTKARAYMRKHRAYVELNGDLPDEVNRKLVAETILLDWKGIKDEGKDVKYSQEAACKIFEKYPDFLESIVDISKDREAFRVEEIAADKETLGKS